MLLGGYRDRFRRNSHGVSIGHNVFPPHSGLCNTPAGKRFWVWMPPFRDREALVIPIAVAPQGRIDGQPGLPARL